MNARQTERVRSYLRGRLQAQIYPIQGTNGFHGCRSVDGSWFEGTLAEIATHFNVTIPDSIMEESASAHPKA